MAQKKNLTKTSGKDGLARASHNAAKRWVKAVNNWGQLGFPRLPEPASVG